MENNLVRLFVGPLWHIILRPSRGTSWSTRCLNRRSALPWLRDRLTCSVSSSRLYKATQCALASSSGRRAISLVLWLFVGTIGALEGMYNRTQYMGDWISYLNVSRAVSAGDWRRIFDPMWNPGYPALVALARAMFPRTPEGEWNAITLLNTVIFLMAYASWRYLIGNALELYDPSLSRYKRNPFVQWIGCCAFLSCALGLDSVSNVSPDLLVTTLFLFATGQTLSLARQPGRARAIVLGLALGVSTWVKSVCLPFALSFLLVSACLQRPRSWRVWSLSAFAFLALLAPYGAAVSWSYGHFTLGVSGPLNYAFHVNHMPHWTNWQGTGSAFRPPIHSTTQLIKDLPAFEFGKPFQTTYPPYNNLAYWYEGAAASFNTRLQFLAVARSIYFVLTIIKNSPYLLALISAILLVTARREWRAAFWRTARVFPLLFLPALIGVFIYLTVHVESRYLSPFCLVFSLLPLLGLLNSSLPSRRVLVLSLLAIYTVGSAAQLKAAIWPAFQTINSGADYHRDPQWQLAAALPSYGLRSGDSVAVIGNLVYRCHWAYVSNLRIIAEFGSSPWTLAPWDRTRLEHISEPADENYPVVFWKTLTAQQRRQVTDAFRSTGARAIIAYSGPSGVEAQGWQQVRGTNFWIYSFAVETASR
jgi:hypothetical protein